MERLLGGAFARGCRTASIGSSAPRLTQWHRHLRLPRAGC